MARERTRPALSNEVISEETSTHDGSEFQYEKHSFDPVPFVPSNALSAAISAGNAVKSDKVVEFWINHPGDSKYDDEKPTRLFTQRFTEVKAKNLAGAIALPGVDGDESKVWDAVSQTSNRNAFQGVYVDMKNAAEGPEKAIEKVQKLLKGLSPAQLEAAKAALGLA
jgi:hypothetical protein